MLRSIGRRTGLAVLTFLMAGGVYLSAPPAPRAAATDCGAYQGSVCWQDESCINILFYKQCTTKYKYYPKPQLL